MMEGEKRLDHSVPEQQSLHLGAVHIGFLYIGALMGAGFASGKEMWQFFGVFGSSGIFGVTLITVIFILFGYMTVSIGRMLGTGDLSKIIMPFENRVFEGIIGFLMSTFLFMAYLSMLAAGGALVQEQFGIHRAVGGIFLMLLVVTTAINGFELVSKRLGKVIPALIAGTLILALILLARYGGDIGKSAPVEASPLASNWFVAALVFVSYNLMAGIPMLGSSAVNARDGKTAKKGAVLGGLLLGLCSLILYLATSTDPVLSDGSALPMLKLCGKLAPAVQVIYAVVLLIAVFGTATSAFYGITTKLPTGGKRKYIICGLAVLGFGLSLFGFSNIVAILYPIEGYAGAIFLILMAIHYVRLLARNKNKKGDEDGNESLDL